MNLSPIYSCSSVKLCDKHNHDVINKPIFYLLFITKINMVVDPNYKVQYIVDYTQAEYLQNN